MTASVMSSPYIILVTWCMMATHIADVRGQIVVTSKGQVMGIMEKDALGKVVNVYYGIPFAKPPVGDLRFEDPVENDGWGGVRDGTKHPNSCPQRIGKDGKSYENNFRQIHFSQSEDCLYLNVYVPAQINRSAAVMLVIHGGSNRVGSGVMHDGKYLASHGGIIVVTINYRLGFLGFMGMGHPDFRGNYGLLDQLMAMKWVQKEIGAFGGDKNRVTLFGHSAGAMDVGLHVVSPLSKGMFQRAISQSGSPTSPLAWIYPRPYDQLVYRFVAYGLKFAGCDKQEIQDSSTLHDLKACLKKVDLTEYTSADHDYVFRKTKLIDHPYSFRAIVDGHFLPNDPVELMRQGLVNTQEYLIGFTANESDHITLNRTNWYNVEDFMNRNWITTTEVPASEEVWYAYMDWRLPKTSTSQSNRKALSTVFSHLMYQLDAIRTANLAADTGMNVYVYEWNRRPDTGHRLTTTSGVYHGLDMYYLFGDPVQKGPHFRYNYNDVCSNVSYFMMEVWSNYVKHGLFLPTSSVEDYNQKSTNRTDLRKYTSAAGAYLQQVRVGDDGYPQIVVKEKPMEAPLAFWDNYLPGIVGDMRAKLACDTGAPKNPYLATRTGVTDSPWAVSLWIKCNSRSVSEQFVGTAVLIDMEWALVSRQIGMINAKTWCNETTKTRAQKAGGMVVRIAVVQSDIWANHHEIYQKDVLDVFSDDSMGLDVVLLRINADNTIGLNRQHVISLPTTFELFKRWETVPKPRCRRVVYRMDVATEKIEMYTTNVMASVRDRSCELDDFSALTSVCVNDTTTGRIACEMDTTSPVICDNTYGTAKIYGFPRPDAPPCKRGHGGQSWVSDVRFLVSFIGNVVYNATMKAQKSGLCGGHAQPNERTYIENGVTEMCGAGDMYSKRRCACVRASDGDIAVALEDYVDATVIANRKKEELEHMYPNHCSDDGQLFRLCASCGRQLESHVIYDACCAKQSPLADLCKTEFGTMK